MKKLLFALLVIIPGLVIASTITKPYTKSAGQTLPASEYNANLDTIYNDYNGNIDASNLKDSAVTGSKINNGTITPNKMDTTGTYQSYNLQNTYGITTSTFSARNFAVNMSSVVISTNTYLTGLIVSSVTFSSVTGHLDDVRLNSAKKLYLDGGFDTYIAELNANQINMYQGGNEIVRLSAGQVYMVGSNLLVDPTKKIYLDGGTNTYIAESSGDQISFYANVSERFRVSAAGNVTFVNFDPAGAGALSSGDGTNYWNDISYKTLTDRGCLGWFDEGVELQDGKIVSDTEAILAMKKHPTKKTIYGTDMLDYKSFPKVSYKKADKDVYDSEGKKIGKELLPRDANDEPIGGQDGIEMTSVFSIMIGATKELTLRVEKLESDNLYLKKRIEALENK